MATAAKGADAAARTVSAAKPSANYASHGMEFLDDAFRFPESALPGVKRKIANSQYRHLYEHPEWVANGKKSYFRSFADAQTVLDAAHSGRAPVLGFSNSGNPVVRFDGVTGYNQAPGARYFDQPTNIFAIKGTNKVSVVPISPAWRPK